MNAIEVAIKNLQEKKDQLTKFLADGGAKSFELYMGIVGEIKGLTYSINELKDTNDKLLIADNND
jgi:hypothetical protein